MSIRLGDRALYQGELVQVEQLLGGGLCIVLAPGARRLQLAVADLVIVGRVRPQPAITTPEVRA